MGKSEISTVEREKISGYLTDMSTKARAVGRTVVFSVIAASWTLSYSENVFKPSSEIKWSLWLALVYLFLDFLFYIIMTTVYKYILECRFKQNSDGGYDYVNNKDVEKLTKWWMNFGFVWLIAMSLFLLASSVLLILHVLKLQPAF